MSNVPLCVPWTYIALYWYPAAPCYELRWSILTWWQILEVPWRTQFHLWGHTVKGGATGWDARVSVAVWGSTMEFSAAAASHRILSSSAPESQFLCPLKPLPIFKSYSWNGHRVVFDCGFKLLLAYVHFEGHVDISMHAWCVTWYSPLLCSLTSQSHSINPFPHYP